MRTNQLGWTILGVILAVGCSPAPQAESTALQETALEPVAEAEPEGASFDCEGIQLLARFGEDSVTLDLEEGSVTLSRVESETGEEYTDGATTFRTEGDGATLERESGTVTCVAQPLRSEDAGAEGGEAAAPEAEAAQ